MGADVENPASVAQACRGSDVVVCAVGFPYRNRLWAKAWPVAMAALLDGCAAARARFVFADNLYMYGPQTAPLREDMPLTDVGVKPRVRAEITRLWQAAHAAGRVQAVAVRASDFYGPGVTTSALAMFGVKPLARGQPAMVATNPEFPHDFTYVPDFARALMSLIDAPADAYGRAWHVPNAPTRSLREVLELAARLAGAKPRLNILSNRMKPLISLFNGDLAALAEMEFQTDRPYYVDASAFKARFWADATPFEAGLAATLQSFAPRSARTAGRQ
jgi:nucleoside-diphosphate-sugar epimerase